MRSSSSTQRFFERQAGALEAQPGSFKPEKSRCSLRSLASGMRFLTYSSILRSVRGCSVAICAATSCIAAVSSNRSLPLSPSRMPATPCSCQTHWHGCRRADHTPAVSGRCSPRGCSCRAPAARRAVVKVAKTVTLGKFFQGQAFLGRQRQARPSACDRARGHEQGRIGSQRKRHRLCRKSIVATPYC